MRPHPTDTSQCIATMLASLHTGVVHEVSWDRIKVRRIISSIHFGDVKYLAKLHASGARYQTFVHDNPITKLSKFYVARLA